MSPRNKPVTIGAVSPLSKVNVCVLFSLDKQHELRISFWVGFLFLCESPVGASGLRVHIPSVPGYVLLSVLIRV